MPIFYGYLISYIKTGTLKLQVGLLENASMENRSAKGKTCKGGKYKYGKIKYYCARAENASTEKASASEQGQYYHLFSIIPPRGSVRVRYIDNKTTAAVKTA